MTKSWDDIDLGELTMEGSGDSTEDDSNLDKRKQERIDVGKLKNLIFEVKEVIPITVNSPSSKKPLEATILDISPSGIKVAADGGVSENDIVRLSFSIGKHSMSMSGEVRWASEKAFGAQFINPDERDIVYITSILTAMHLG